MLRALGQLHRFYKGFQAAEDCLEETIGRSACMSGCGKCCEVNTVKCMTIEALNAVSILTGTGKLSKVVSLAEGWLLERHKEAPTYEGMLSGRFLPTHIREEAEKLSVLPCPFLDETKACIIHQARPMVCRSYGITRAASGFCPRQPGKGETLSQLMYIKVPELRQDIADFKKSITARHPEWTIFGFLPTVIYKAAEEKKFRKLVHNNQIATAKLIGTQLDTTLMWQPQVEQLRMGVSPELVVC